MLLEFNVALAMGLAFVNGANDLPKGVATLVGSGAARARSALLWSALCTLAGGAAAIALGAPLAQTLTGSVTGAGSAQPDAVFACAVLAGAFAWVAFATWRGLPVSTTHAILGGIVGAACAVYSVDALNGKTLAYKALAPLLLSPLLAGLLCVTLLLSTRWLLARAPAWSPGCCPPQVWAENPYRCAPPSWRLRAWDGLHWASAGAISFARAANDAPKIGAFLVLGSTFSSAPALTLGAVTLAMIAGGLLAAGRVLRVLEERILTFDTPRAVAANVGAAAIVLAATPLGLPVSTTHVTTGGLFGVRLAERAPPHGADAARAVVYAWAVSLPVRAGVAYLTASLLS